MLGHDERHQKNRQCRLIVYTCIDLPGTRTGIHLQSGAFLPLITKWQRSHPPPHSDVGYAARYGHGAVSPPRCRGLKCPLLALSGDAIHPPQSLSSPAGRSSREHCRRRLIHPSNNSRRLFVVFQLFTCTFEILPKLLVILHGSVVPKLTPDLDFEAKRIRWS